MEAAFIERGVSLISLLRHFVSPRAGGEQNETQRLVDGGMCKEAIEYSLRWCALHLSEGAFRVGRNLMHKVDRADALEDAVTTTGAIDDRSN